MNVYQVKQYFLKAILQTGERETDIILQSYNDKTNP